MFVYTPETIEIDICGDTDTLHRPHNESKQFYRDTLFQMGGRGEIYPLDERFIDEHSEMMRPIYSGDSLIGVAAINCAGEQVSKGMGTHTIGTIGNPVGRAAGSFVGWIETLPDGAKRNPSANSVDKKAVQAWAKDQYQQVIGKNLNDIQNIFVSYRLSEFDVDVSELVKIPIAINGTVFTAKISDIVGLTRSLPLCIFKASVGDFIETHHQVNSVPGYMLVRPIINGNLNNLTFSEGKPTNPNSLIFMIETALARAGAISSWSLENTVYNATYFGPMQLVRCHVIWP